MSKHLPLSRLLFALVAAAMPLLSKAFFLPAQTTTESSSPSRLNMCICINCKRVTDCAAYHFVETKHEQPHMTETPTFEPRDGSPTIHVHVRTVRTKAKQPNDNEDDSDNNNNSSSVGSTVSECDKKSASGATERDEN